MCIIEQLLFYRVPQKIEVYNGPIGSAYALSAVCDYNYWAAKTEIITAKISLGAIAERAQALQFNA